MSAVMAAALGTAAWSSYAGAKRAARLVERGEGLTLLAVVGARFRDSRRPPTDEDLAELVARHTDSGLRYVAFIGHDHQVVAQAGAPAAGTEPWLANLDAGPERNMVTLGELRGLAVLRPPMGPRPRGGPRGGPPGFPFGGPPPGGRPFGGPPPDGPQPEPFPDEPLPNEPLVNEPPSTGQPGGSQGSRRRWRRSRRGLPGHIGFAIEYEPVQAAELAETSAVTLWLGLGTTFAFLLTAGLTITLLRQRARLEARAAGERQLAALGEMSAVLAHEIRNPLASLKGHAQLLAEALPAGSREQNKATRVVREAVRLEGLSNDLLDFVRAGAVQRRDVSVAQVLREANDAVGDPRVVLQLDNAPNTWSLDSTRMRQVIENLLLNALEASDKSKPTASDKSKPAASGTDQRVSLKASVTDGRLIIECRDRGLGLPAGAGEAEKIFEPFHTTRTQGTGLGLAVARRIVELHGGTLTAENAPEGGALFTVSVPRS
jgi:two-component system, NtrC family, sensor histidine kinase HydH